MLFLSPFSLYLYSGKLHYFNNVYLTLYLVLNINVFYHNLTHEKILPSKLCQILGGYTQMQVLNFYFIVVIFYKQLSNS